MQDFTNRVYEKLSKLSESQIERIFKDLKSQNSIYKSIFESLATGLVTVDKNWHLIEMNKAAERLLPILSNLKDTQIENEQFFNLIEDKDISLFFKDCFDKNKTNISDTYTHKTSGGSVRFIEVSVSPFVSDCEITGSIILIEDVTQKRNQEVLLHRMETMAGLTNLAASVAHEIKNPLGAISIHIQLLQKTIKRKRESDGFLPEPKFLENYLDVVNQEIDRLNKIVVDFLLAVRPISAEFSLVKINDFLNNFVQFITPEFNENKIKIETSFTKENPKLCIDEKLFRDVLVNLAQNSLAAILERHGKAIKNNPFEEVFFGHIKILSEIKNDRFILHFIDNGSGMSSEVQNHIFEPYFTTKANGTGLGLAMTYKVIKEFSGDISLQSTLGEGTEFIINLPIPQTHQKLLGHK